MQRYALKGGVSGELISYGGRVLVHDNRRELDYLFPNLEVVEIKVGDDDGLYAGRPTMSVKEHPQVADNVQWPLDKNDWVTP